MIGILETPNPAYIQNPSLAAQRKIKVEGFHASECPLVIAMLKLQNGQVALVVDGVEATFQNLVEVHQLISTIMTELDRRLFLQAQTIPGDK